MGSVFRQQDGHDNEGERAETTWWDRRAGFVMYPIAVASYVIAGISYKPLLNWLIGPSWIVLTVAVLPWALRSSRRASR